MAGDETQTAVWTGDDEDFQRSWTAAKTLTADNPSQQSRLDQLCTQQREYKAVCQELMALRREVTTGGTTMVAVIEAFKTGRSFAVFDAVHNRLDDF